MSIREDAWISFAIDIFIGNDQEGYKLKQVRSTRQEGASGVNSFSIFTIIGAVDNLPPGEQTIKVAVNVECWLDLWIAKRMIKPFSQ